MRLHLIKNEKKNTLFKASPLNLLSIKHCTLKHMTSLPKTETIGRDVKQIYKNTKIRGHCPYSDFVLKQNIYIKTESKM